MSDSDNVYRYSVKSNTDHIYNHGSHNLVESIDGSSKILKKQSTFTFMGQLSSGSIDNGSVIARNYYDDHFYSKLDGDQQARVELCRERAFYRNNFYRVYQAGCWLNETQRGRFLKGLMRALPLVFHVLQLSLNVAVPGGPIIYCVLVLLVMLFNTVARYQHGDSVGRMLLKGVGELLFYGVIGGLGLNLEWLGKSNLLTTLLELIQKSRAADIIAVWLLTAMWIVPTANSWQNQEYHYLVTDRKYMSGHKDSQSLARTHRESLDMKNMRQSRKSIG